MKIRRGFARTATILVAGGTIMWGLPATGATPATQSRPSFCDDEAIQAQKVFNSFPSKASGRSVAVAKQECNLIGRRIVDHGAALIVAPEGVGVGTEEIVESPDGGTYGELLIAETSATGTVIIKAIGSEADESDVGGGSSSAPNACDDPKRNLAGHKSPGQEPWYFKASSWEVPQANGPDLSDSLVVAALRDGMIDVTHMRNNCDLDDTVSASAEYRGTTDRNLDMESGGACQNYFLVDSYQVVAFGNLAESKVAKTCWWFQPLPGNDALLTWDIRFNRTDKNWTNQGGSSNCNNDYDIEGVMAHEVGHVFGLGHAAPESDHANLTMSPSTSACQESANQRTLGRGDILGLRDLY